MFTELLTPATSEPVTLQQAKLQCRVDSNEEDALFTDIIIPGARDECEQLLRRSIMLNTWRATLDAFPAGAIELAWPRLQTVESLEFRASDGSWSALSPSLYTVGTASAKLTRLVGSSWPATSAEPESVRITYKSGYSAGNDEAQRAAVPPSVKHWLLLRIATAYVYRDELVAGTIVAELPGRLADSLLDRERIWSY